VLTDGRGWRDDIDSPKVGDLVNFNSNSWVMMREDYLQRNPGIVISSQKDRHMILWSDKTTTIEHKCYLEVISENW